MFRKQNNRRQQAVNQTQVLLTILALRKMHQKRQRLINAYKIYMHNKHRNKEEINANFSPEDIAEINANISPEDIAEINEEDIAQETETDAEDKTQETNAGAEDKAQETETNAEDKGQNEKFQLTYKINNPYIKDENVEVQQKNNLYNKYSDKTMKLWSSLIKPKNYLKTLILIRDISMLLRDKLKDIDLEKNILNPDIILYICNILENSYNKKNVADKKINKKQVVIDIIKNLIPNVSPDVLLQIDTLIEHLHSSGSIIKISTIMKMFHLSKFFFQK